MLLILIAATALSISLVSADPATVLHPPVGCMVANLEGELVAPVSPPRGNGTIVVTQSANGNWTAVCTGKLPAGSTLPAQAYIELSEEVGGSCGIPGWILTDDWKQLITPSGQVMLTCHFPEKPFSPDDQAFLERQG